MNKFEYLTGKTIYIDKSKISVESLLGEGNSCVTYFAKNNDKVNSNVLLKEFVPVINEEIGRNAYLLLKDDNKFYRVLPSLRDEFNEKYDAFLKNNNRITELLRSVSENAAPDSEDAKIYRYIALPDFVSKYPNGNDLKTTLDNDNKYSYILCYNYDSRDLDKKLADLSIIDKLRIVKQLCFVIGKFHKNNIIIADLKPENFLYDMDGEFPVLKLFDFDSALIVDDHGLLDLNELQSPKGSPFFSAPEVIKKITSSIGIHSDIYSLGAILFYLLLFGNEKFMDLYNHSNPYLELHNLDPDEMDLLLDELRINDSRVTTGFINRLKNVLKKCLTSEYDFYERYRKDESNTATERLEKEIQILMEIYENKGIHPEVILDHAIKQAEEFSKSFTIDEDLLAEVEIIED